MFSGLVTGRCVRAAARLTRRNPCGFTTVSTIVRLIGSAGRTGRGGRTVPPQHAPGDICHEERGHRDERVVGGHRYGVVSRGELVSGEGTGTDHGTPARGAAEGCEAAN